MEFKHYSVMLEECLEGLAISPDGIYVDGTVGGAGHSSRIAAALSQNGRLICFDRDPDALETAKQRLNQYPNVSFVHSNFMNMKSELENLGISPLSVNGALLDLGVSSYQLDTPERGFSYNNDAALDMRMSKEGMSAEDLVNTFSQQELSRIIYEYGEERFASKIAAAIVNRRSKQPIKTTLELADIIKEAMPAFAKRDKHPCKRTFQAIRIAVNSELDSLSQGIDSAFEMLAPGGRLVIITFHSLEDRMVKQKFAKLAQGCTCPPDFPICVCGNKPKGKLISRKPILPSERELSENSRSKSAKLRIIEKI